MIRALLAIAAMGLTSLAASPVFAALSPVQAADNSDQTRVMELLVRVREDPAVQRTGAALEAAVRSAMARLDPEFTNREARTRALREEVAAAQAAGDQGKLNLLAQEVGQLRSYFARVEERAAQDPEVIAARQRHEATMTARMTELDPEAPALIERVWGAPGR